MKTIIVQDTEPDILEILTIILQAKYKVYPFLYCNDEFVHLLESKPYLILMEHKLQGFNCLETLKKIKADYPQIPVVGFTTDRYIEEKYKGFPFDEYLLKPFDLNTLFETIERNIKVFSSFDFVRSLRLKPHQIMENELYHLSRVLKEFADERKQFTCKIKEFEKLQSKFLEIHFSDQNNITYSPKNYRGRLNSNLKKTG
jgi:DNA-binding response OmpR family regulator